MSDKANTVIVEQLRETRALRDDVAALRRDLRAIETKIDGLAAMMAAIAGARAGRGDEA